MPGLVGFFCRDKPDERLLGRMIESLKHENWYRVDEYQDTSCGIARIHLGIFNPQSQPIFNEDNSLLIFFDGKIYGYEKELDMLKEKGHTFRLDNDPEFCLHSYEERGKDFVRDLNGNFVLVNAIRETTGSLWLTTGSVSGSTITPSMTDGCSSRQNPKQS
jgi:asparagine synthase (glutamine-hydrolysing)